MPSPLHAMAAPSLGGDLRLEKLAAAGTFLAVPETRNANPLALAQAVVPGNPFFQTPSQYRFGVAEWLVSKVCRIPGNGVGSRAPPREIPS